MEHLKTLASFTGSDADSGTVSCESCLSDDEILSFAKGELDPSRVEVVHAHLDGCAVCQQLVTEAVHALDAEPMSETARPSWNAVFQPGALIAKRYRIQRLLARGGMGEVYLCFDTSLHERVALKTVTATHCDSAEAVRLLKAEVQHARRIAHPNVCRIFDLGTHVMEPSGGEIQFLVMEYIEGEALGKRLRTEGPLAVEVAHSIAHQLLRGLAAAHQAGILHRDFKSDNVMVRPESNGRTTAVILDFGLAKVLNESGNIVTTQQHQSQAMVGTIGYMAPEQIEGEPLTTASDIYSFGVVWFEMLTGRLPFEAKTLAASALARLHHSPDPPSQYNPRVPKWLDEIVMRCLSRHREIRFTSAEAVLGALASGPSLSEEPPHVLKRVLRHRLLIAAGLLGGGIIALGAALARHKADVQVPRVDAIRVEPPKAEIATDIAPTADRGVGANVGDSPPAARASSQPKVRNPNRELSQHPKPLRPPEAPVAERTTPSVTVVEPEASTTPPTTPSVVLSSRKPDWLPLSKNRKPSEAQLQVE